MRKENADLKSRCDELFRTAEADRIAAQVKADSDRAAIEARFAAMMSSFTSTAQAKDAQLAEASRTTEILRSEVQAAQADADRNKTRHDHEVHSLDEQSRMALQSQEARIKAEAEARHNEAM